MSTNTEIVETIPFNFDEVYEGIAAKFADKGYDSLYEGSNTSQLIAAMSYLTSMLNANTAVNINETLLTLANKRDNVLKDARILGYEIVHITSYRYNITIQYEEVGTYIIPKYTEFKSGDNLYYYMGDEDSFDITIAGGTHEIEVKEGELKTADAYPDLLHIVTTSVITDGEAEIQYYIDIPFTNIEDQGIEAFLTYYDESGNLRANEYWTRSDQFMIDKDSVLENQFMRLDNIEYKTGRIYFKLAGIGPGIRVGTLVDLNILISKGDLGVMENIPLTSLDKAAVISYSLVAKGSQEEEIQSIKDNAPLFHNSANRVITKSDYIAMSTRHTAVSAVEVWDGDSERIPKAGYIWFSFLPNSITGDNATLNVYDFDDTKLFFNLFEPENQDTWFVTDEQIESTVIDGEGKIVNPGVWDVLNQYKVPTLVFENRHPLYIDFSLTIDVMKYIVKTSKADIYQNIFNIVQRYFEGVDIEGVVNIGEQLVKFDTEYFNSNLDRRIDTDLTDITGFSTDLITTIMLSEKNLTQQVANTDNYDIFIPLSVPYEDYFSGTGELISSMMPNINTLDFINSYELVVDWGTPSTSDEETLLLTYNITSNGVVVGEYAVFNSVRKEIIVTLYVGDLTGTPDGNYATPGGYTLAHFNTVENTKYDLSLSYYSPNFKTIKNCIPRLKQVLFQ